jgi:hypothetical protein
MNQVALTGALPRTTAWLLIAGAICFWVGAGTPPYRQWMGPPVKEYLSIIGAHRPNWYFIHGAFLLGCALTVAGLGGLTALLRAAGDRGWSIVALALFVLGTALWFVHVGHRLAVTPWAAAELARTGEVPAGYEAIKSWMGLLFGMYMVLAYLALAAYGAALLGTGLLPRWVGLTAVIFGLAAVPGLATPVFQPPLMVHVVPFIVGIAILRA